MNKSCKLFPDDGLQLFKEVKERYGTKAAWDVYKVVTNAKLKGQWTSLSKDSEGFPLFSELIKSPVIQYTLGDRALLGYEEDKFTEMPFNQKNYNDMLQEVYNYNTNPENTMFAATVVETKDGNIKVKVNRRNARTIGKFNSQYSANRLNNRLATIFAPLGVTVGTLTEIETRAGRIGVTEFGQARSIANSFANMIRIANNLEGNFALSEEFSHLLVAIFREEPLIKRALNSINNEKTLRAILEDEYDELVNFYSGDYALIAEEALGKLLRKNLLSEELNELGDTEHTLVDRATNLTKRNFKGYDATEVDKAIIEADNTMSQLAKNILSGTVEITKEQIKEANKRTVRFNALSDRIAHNIDILKEAKKVELKRYKMSPYSTQKSKETQEKLIDTLDSYMDSGIDTVLGLTIYSASALDVLQNLDEELNDINSLPPMEQFKLLRRVRSYIQSYGSFIKNMQDALLAAEEDSEASNLYDDIEIGEEKISLKENIKDLNHLSSRLASRYEKLAVSLFAEFLKPFFGEEALMAYNKRRGTNKTLEDILKSTESDISLSERYLDSMADSSDILLQLFDRAVKAFKDKARFKTIRDIESIQALRLEAEEQGLTDFTWLFEVDDEGNMTGNYIGEINYGKFDRARERMEAALEKKYGRHARGEQAKLKAAEKAQWYRENTVGESRTPNSKYKNEVFANMTEAQKEFRRKFLELKSHFDYQYPQGRVDTLKAIQMRKTGGNRILESLGSPSTIFSNIKESIKATFLEAEDDDEIFGEKIAKGMTNFDGSEFMLLPVLYTNRLKNPNELTTDVFASLMGYAYSSNTYDEMSKVIDPLEVGRTLFTDNIRKTTKTRGGKRVREEINVLGQKHFNRVILSESNARDRLDDFFESQIYQRYLKDEGTIGSTRINTTKTVSWLLKANSMVQLGLNWLANSANIATGLAMANIEAASSEFFGVSELASADKEYSTLLPSFLAELGSRNKTNKLSLFNTLFDVRQNFGSKVKYNQKKNILQKLFGESIAYLGQEAGDHWLYSRVAIAICKRLQVLVPKNSVIRKKIRDFASAQNIVAEIVDNSRKIQLTSDERYYVDSNNTKHVRVTNAIQSESEGNVFSATHEDGSPNNWILPSTNIGTGFDEMTRDFFGDKITYSNGTWIVSGKKLSEVYPNANEEDLQAFAAQLSNFKETLKEKGLTIVPRDITVRGFATVNVGGKLRQIPVAGTLDLLAYDKDGNFYIYDMKTHRGNISGQKRRKWMSQLSLYKKFLEDEYGVKVKETSIIPIKVNYPTPVGEKAAGEDGTVEYTVIENSNQLLMDGEEFKGASPELESVIAIPTREIILDYETLDKEDKSMVTDHRKEINTNDYSQMSLWDALQVVDAIEGRSDIKKMVLPEGSLMTDSLEAVDLGLISRQIAKINQSLFGIYNDDDANAANRVSLGRALQQYRKWMKPLYNRRFQKAQEDVILGNINEGYYRTLGRYMMNRWFCNIANELKRGEVQVPIHWSDLSDTEKSNIKRAVVEIIQFLAVLALVKLIDWPDDKDRPWREKFMQYMAQRELHELGGLVPTPLMVKELSKTVQSPLPIMSSVNAARRAIFSLIDPDDWTNEIQSGPYKGMNNVQKYWLQSPIPGIAQYRQMDRFLSDIDTSILFYIRGN